jgi:hypothetical protein
VERWRAFLMDADPKEEAIRRQDWLLGEAALVRETQDRGGRPAGRGRGRPARGSGTKQTVALGPPEKIRSGKQVFSRDAPPFWRTKAK